MPIDAGKRLQTRIIEKGLARVRQWPHVSGPGEWAYVLQTVAAHGNFHP